MLWNYKDTYLVHVELSNRCNAACPLCPRYVNHSLKVNPELDLGSVSLESFKNWFPFTYKLVIFD
jgi:MoaA/NifB/PqqE/SkfB family radical SAM enzyme